MGNTASSDHDALEGGGGGHRPVTRMKADASRFKAAEDRYNAAAEALDGDTVGRAFSRIHGDLQGADYSRAVRDALAALPSDEQEEAYADLADLIMEVTDREEMPSDVVRAELAAEMRALPASDRPVVAALLAKLEAFVSLMMWTVHRMKAHTSLSGPAVRVFTAAADGGDREALRRRILVAARMLRANALLGRAARAFVGAV